MYAFAAWSLQSCPILCDPVNCSPPGSSVHGILQARLLKWVVVPLFSRGPSWHRDQTQFSCIAGRVFTVEPPGKPYRLYVCIVCIYHIKKSFHPSANTWVSSTPWVFWIVLLWTRMCKYLSAVLFPVLLDLYPEVLCLDHMVILLSIFWGIFLLFSVITAPFYISTSSIWGFFFPHLC